MGSHGLGMVDILSFGFREAGGKERHLGTWMGVTEVGSLRGPGPSLCFLLLGLGNEVLLQAQCGRIGGRAVWKEDGVWG